MVLSGQGNGLTGPGNACVLSAHINCARVPYLAWIPGAYAGFYRPIAPGDYYAAKVYSSPRHSLNVDHGCPHSDISLFAFSFASRPTNSCTRSHTLRNNTPPLA